MHLQAEDANICSPVYQHHWDEVVTGSREDLMGCRFIVVEMEDHIGH